MSAAKSLSKVYSESQEHVRRAGLDIEKAHVAYGAYVNYVDGFTSLAQKVVVDVGCGNGWSSHLLSTKGACVTGVDLHAAAFEPTKSPHLNYQQGSATALPFASASADIVATHECLEHVDSPQKALAEFDRVLKPGGMVFVVGPNLLSVLQSFRGLLIYVWKSRPVKNIFFRSQGMPSHPHGNTLPEIFVKLWVHLYWIAKLGLLRVPLFQMREPDLKPPFHADNDACYYLNPLDLKYYFESRGYEIVNYSGKNRPTSTALIASGTWFCARKPEQPIQ